MQFDADFGKFTPLNEDSWDEIDEVFDNTLEQYENGDLSRGEFVSFCKNIIKREPLYFDAYAHIGITLRESNPTESAKYYKKGVEIGISLLSESYRGEISWLSLSNRPFLRCHHGYILSLVRKRKYKLAVEEIEKHLGWNENDNIGVRYLIGELYILTKNYALAKDSMVKYVSEHPPYCYSLGLLAFLEKNYASAITYFRFGFLMNPYLAEVITGRVRLIKHKFWHGTSRMHPEMAISHLEYIGEELWAKHMDAIIFLDWLFNCSFVLKERSAFVECLEALDTEDDFNKRGTLIANENLITNNINDETSATLVKKITFRGRDRWPWESGDILDNFR